jgi:hypothetical protein
MAVNWLKKSMVIASLAVAPLAYADDTGVMDTALQDSTEAVLAAVPMKSAEEQHIETLKTELDAIRSELNARREQEDRREALIGDPDSHPLWP